MNRVYRLIWNHRLGALVPVAEISRARGKRGGRGVLVAGVAALIGATAASAADGVTAANTNTTVYNAPNGVPVVDISRANGAGLSHNQYTQYNIDTRGLVLNNNSPLSRSGALPSQLAGAVQANPNLVNEARVILNEVVEANRSRLDGYTEVVGGRADVVVANPWGITCKGCGFINTDRALLVTGVPGLGADGGLLGFTVNGGDILIEGVGLDASKQNILDLVARSIKLDGQLNGKDVGLTAGANRYDYVQRNAVALTAGAGAPQYAIDSTALGGMYAQRIRLTATEAGVGVRMLGTAAASADDFSLTSAGKIELGNKISAQRDLSIRYTGGTLANALSLSGAATELSAKRDLTLSLALGGLSMQGAKLTADQDLTVQAASMSDAATAVATRFAGRALAVTLSGVATINQASWGAGSTADWQMASLTVGQDGATLYAGSNNAATARTLSLRATQGNLNLANAQIKAPGDIELKATESIDLGSSGAVQGGEDILVTFGNAMSNQGQILGQQTLTLATDRAQALLRNQGRLQAGAALTLGAPGHELKVQQTQTGAVLGDELKITASSLENAGVLQARKTIDIESSGGLANQLGGRILNTATAEGLRIRASSIDNSGAIQSAGTVDASATGVLTNAGTILTTASNQDVLLSANRVENAERGIVESRGNLFVTAEEGLSNAGNLLIVGDNTLSLNAENLDNSGKIEADGLVVIQVADTMTNTAAGKLMTTGADQHIRITAENLNNAGGIQSAASLTALIGQQVSNSGQMITRAQDGALKIQAASLTNSGDIQSAADLEAIVAAGVTNSGLMLTTQSGKALTLRGQTLSNSGTAQSAGALTADFGGAVTNTISGKLLADGAGDLTLKSAALNNAGVVQSKGALQVTATGAIDNDGTLLATEAGKAVTITGTALDNAGTVQSAHTMDVTVTGGLTNSGQMRTTGTGGNLTVSAAGLTNSGETAASGALTLSLSQALSNTGTGKLLTTGSGSALTVTAASLDNAGTVQSAGALSGTLSGNVSNSGTLATLGASAGGSAGALTLASSGGKLDNATSGKIDSASSATLTAATTMSNAGAIRATGAISATTGSKFDNVTNASIIGGGDVTLVASATGFDLNNDGRIQSSGKLSLGSVASKATLDNAANGVLSGDTFAIEAGTVTNKGRLQGAKGGTLNASSLTNSGSASKIIAATQTGASTFTVSGAVLNEGAMHANDNFTVKGASISNSSTGGLSSLAALNVEATSGNLSNAGALYSGGDMSLKASSLVENQLAATINSDAKVTSTSSSFKNKGEVVVANLEINTTSSFQNGFDQSELPTIILDTANPIYSDANEIKHEKWYCNVAGSACQEFFLYERTVTVKEVLSAPLPTIKPQMIATNTMTINYGSGTGANNAGVLSAQTINIAGSGTFTNQDFELQEHKSGQRWLALKHNSTFDDIAWEFFYPRSGEQYDNAPRAGCDDCDDPSWQAGGMWSFVTVRDMDPDFPAGGLGSARNQFVSNNPPQDRLDKARDLSFTQDLGKETYATSGAGIFAQTLSFSGGTLRNYGSTSRNAPTRLDGPNAVDPVTGQPVGVVSGGAAASGLAGSNGVGALAGGAQGAQAVNGLSFAGLNLQLPTNPNGFFVVNKDPNAGYLVETNPLFGVEGNFLGSNYFVERYGYNPDTVTKRLGDANYEAYLIRQQLISQTGSNLIAGQKTEAEQMQALMDQAIAQSAGLGLSFGKALTPSQIAGLTQDIVWMEEVVVNGQTVLAPRVYLASATRDLIVQGAAIVAAKTSIDAKSVTNVGGTIAGGDSLTIKSQGDVTNTSGTIKGGSVSVTSTGGSIINQTATEGHGDALSYKTTIGKTATIEATKDLKLDASKDIKIVGADVKAKEGGSLKAGGDITVDTIVDKTTVSSTREESTGWGALRSNATSETVTSEKNIGSTLDIGGGLKLQSGGDTTIAGSKVTADSLEAKTGGNFSIEARQDKVTTQTSSMTSGIGVGGGVVGTSKTTTDDFVGTNVGSSVQIKNGAKVDAGGKLTLQGSDMTVGGNASLKAKEGIEILDGLDERRTTSVTQTSTIGKFSSESSAGADSASGSESKKGGTSASAGASAGASAEASNKTNVTAYETQTSTTQSGKKTSVSSNLKVGGDLTATTDGTLTVQGSNVESGGDMKLDAKKIEVLTGRNEEYSNTTTTTDTYGLFSENEASAEAGAQAGARSDMAGAAAQGQAKASAKAESTTTIGVRTTTEGSQSYSLTNSASTLKSGGNMAIKAKETATFVGADVEAGGDLAIEAKDIVNKAAQDINYSSKSTDTRTAGVYVGAEAEVSAEAQGSGGTGARAGGSGSASASASAEGSVGLRYATTADSEYEKSTTNVTNSFKAGGNLSRKAENMILDQGTSLEAGGDINQSARVIKEEAIHDTVESGTSSSSMDARIGAYAGASASASADSNGNADASAEAGTGFKASIDGGKSSTGSTVGTAVTSKYKAGGSITSKSTESTTLVGTQFEAGKDVNIEAGSLDYQAAKDFKTESSSDQSYGGELKLGSGQVSAEGEYAQDGTGSSSTKAKAGSISAGGNVNLKTTQGDLTLEGTNIDGQGAVKLDSAGNLDIKAARDTEESRTDGFSVGGSLSGSSGGGGASASGSYDRERASSSTAQAATIKGGSVSLSGAKDVSLEGTKLDSKGDTSIEAGGNVNLKAATNTSSNSSISASASLGASSEKGDDGSKTTSQNGGFNLGGEMGSSASSDGASINSGGALTIKGKTVVNQEAELKSQDGTRIDGQVENQKAANHDVQAGFDVGASASSEKKSGGN